MKALYYDCFCGISGDMNLGAMLDLGVDEGYLRGELSRLGLDDEFDLRVEQDSRHGIGGTRVDVLLKESGHTHEALAHGHDSHHHESHHHQGQRTLRGIESLILASNLNEPVKRRSCSMFRRIAQAEAKIHQTTLEEVHFHEVGAVDSIVDLVGAAICLEYLQVDIVMASPVQVGGGFVKCAHGVLPVPAPATAELLSRIPIRTGAVPFETTTPTGAVILADSVEEFTEQMKLTPEKIGYGIGHRELDIPNVLRLYLGQVEPEGQARQSLLETNIDDMNPELYGYVEEKLFAKGALDVFKTAIMMKKGRPAIKLSVLVAQENEGDVMDVIFRETTSLGVRRLAVDKIMMERTFEAVPTRFGTVTVKYAYAHGERIKYKPEYEDCRRIAEETGIPLPEVYREVEGAVERYQRGVQ